MGGSPTIHHHTRDFSTFFLCRVKGQFSFIWAFSDLFYLFCLWSSRRFGRDFWSYASPEPLPRQRQSEGRSRVVSLRIRLLLVSVQAAREALTPKCATRCDLTQASSPPHPYIASPHPRVVRTPPPKTTPMSPLRRARTHTFFPHRPASVVVVAT